MRTLLALAALSFLVALHALSAPAAAPGDTLVIRVEGLE